MKLAESRSASKSRTLITQFKLSDEYRESFGRYLLRTEANSASAREARKLVMLHASEEMKADASAIERQVGDVMFCHDAMRFKHWEYYAFGLADKTTAEWNEFLRMGELNRIYQRIIDVGLRETVNTLRNKAKCYEVLKPFFKRDVLVLDEDTDMGLLKSFTKDNPEFFVKPVDGALGQGVRLVGKGAYWSTRKLRADLLKDGPVICEERIIPHHEIARLYPHAVNCVRIVTYFDGEDFDIMYPWMKVGTGGAVIDNAGAGGLICSLDEKTGVVISDGGNEAAELYEKHPDTGVVFKGFQVPEWQALVDTALAAARALPNGKKPVGWDFALSEDKGWQLVEGNGRAQIGLFQIPLRQGIKPEFLERMRISAADLKKARL